MAYIKGEFETLALEFCSKYKNLPKLNNSVAYYYKIPGPTTNHLALRSTYHWLVPMTSMIRVNSYIKF